MKVQLFLVQYIIFSLLCFNGYSQQEHNKIELADVVLNGKFIPEAIRNIRSMNDGEYYTTLTNNAILRYSYKTGRLSDTLFSSVWFVHSGYLEIAEYEFSNDENSILLTTNKKPIYRHSFSASYFVYNRVTKKIIPVSVNGPQQLATFSPDNKHIAFVRDNNIFIVDLVAGTEKSITIDGKYNFIINGAPDWVYEEEFGFSKAFAWSPDGNELAYMRFDESMVRTFSMTKYDSLYPSVYTFKYPKAGEDNSIVSVHVYNLTTGLEKKMDVGSETNQYIPGIKWTSVNNLGIIRLNRHQNKVELLLENTVTGNKSIIYEETNKYFISDVSDNFITYTSDGKYFIIFSERSGYQHLYLYDMQGKFINAVTQGNFDVDELLAVDNTNHLLYYTSAETSPLNRNVYSIAFDGSAKKRISEYEGTNTAEFSTSFKYYILTTSSANAPPSYVLYNAKGKLVRVLEDNKQLQDRMHQYNFQKKEFIKVPVNENLELNGYMIKPSNFDTTKKYPVFMFVYGGPQSQDVTNSWERNLGWFQYLTQQGYIVACVDNRGTDGRGEEFRKCTYMQLGKYELEDQVNAAKYFGSLHYIDKSRIGIFGWSYGGYMSSLCMTKGEGVFKMGIAVAPVTNWRYYDNIYTERFMRTPQENQEGYDDNSPINFADKLQGSFLLVHGSADDNVHLQNTMVFSEKLVQAGKKFDEAIYMDKNHGIYGGNTRLHLYTRMTDFILKNL